MNGSWLFTYNAMGRFFFYVPWFNEGRVADLQGWGVILRGNPTVRPQSALWARIAKNGQN